MTGDGGTATDEWEATTGEGGTMTDEREATTGEGGAMTDELERAGRHVRSVNEAVQGELSALREQLVPLAGLWTGRAAAELTRLMTRWDAGSRSLNEALSGIGELIEGVAPGAERQADAGGWA